MKKALLILLVLVMLPIASAETSMMQCRNGGGIDQNVCDWHTGSINKQNSYYVEDMSVPHRLTVEPDTPGTQHTVTITHAATKGGKHTYDFLTGWNQGNAATGVGEITLNHCEDLAGDALLLCEQVHEGGAATYTNLDSAQIAVPDDNFQSKDGDTLQLIQRYEQQHGNRFITIRSDQKILTSDATLAHSDTEDDGDTDVAVTLTWSTDQPSDVYMIEFGGHLSSSQDYPEGWGIPLGASFNQGANYHIWTDATGGQNQIQGDAIFGPGNPPPPEDTYCGDRITQPLNGQGEEEQCDDGNNDFGDGCTPACRWEPICPDGGPCESVCGDGILFPEGDETCDDGNRESGDGCSSDCQVENGWSCTTQQQAVGDTLELPVVIRDHLQEHIDMERDPYDSGIQEGIVQDRIGEDGKPAYLGADGTTTVDGPESFDSWYNDRTGINYPILESLTFTRDDDGDLVYRNNDYFPINDRGFGNQGRANNFHFTTETRYWFTYRGDEVFKFTGDDDVFAFINGILVIDLGGVHGARSDTVALATDPRLSGEDALEVGRVYEIAVFHAERHTTASNYELALGKFENEVSFCKPTLASQLAFEVETIELDGSISQLPGWKINATAAIATPKKQQVISDASGQAVMDYALQDDSDVVVYIESQPGHVFSSATCEGVETEIGSKNDIVNITGLTLSPNEQTRCTITNRRIAPNPDIDDTCELDIMLLMDVSGSIEDPELEIMKASLTNFVDEMMTATNSHVGVTKFSNYGKVELEFSEDVQTVKDKINDIDGDGATNWQDGLIKASSREGREDIPNLILIATDGNPTWWVDDAGEGVNDNEVRLKALEMAVYQANLIKDSGTRIVAVGISENSPTERERIRPQNLQAISGPVLDSDYYTARFDQLADKLTEAAQDLCSGSITVNKRFEDPPGQYAPLQDWEFVLDVDGAYADSTSQLTDENGDVFYGLKDVTDNGATITLSEVMQEGIIYGSASCTNQYDLSTPDDDVIIPADADGVITTTMYPGDVLVCQYDNLPWPYCGDGLVNEPGEQCDCLLDEEGNPTDECDQLPEGYICTTGTVENGGCQRITTITCAGSAQDKLLDFEADRTYPLSELFDYGSTDLSGYSDASSTDDAMLDASIDLSSEPYQYRLTTGTDSQVEGYDKTFTADIAIESPTGDIISCPVEARVVGTSCIGCEDCVLDGTCQVPPGPEQCSFVSTPLYVLNTPTYTTTRNAFDIRLESSFKAKSIVFVEELFSVNPSNPTSIADQIRIAKDGALDMETDRAIATIDHEDYEGELRYCREVQHRGADFAGAPVDPESDLLVTGNRAVTHYFEEGGVLQAIGPFTFTARVWVR